MLLFIQTQRHKAAVKSTVYGADVMLCDVANMRQVLNGVIKRPVFRGAGFIKLGQFNP